MHRGEPFSNKLVSSTPVWSSAPEPR